MRLKIHQNRHQNVFLEGGNKTTFVCIVFTTIHRLHPMYSIAIVILFGSTVTGGGNSRCVLHQR